MVWVRSGPTSNRLLACRWTRQSGGAMRRALLCVFAMSLPLVAQQRIAMPSVSPGKVDYEKDVKPLLEQNCYSCHGETVQQSGLRLDLRQNALRGGDYGPVILPGKSAESKLIKRLVDGDGGMQMPPTGPLSPEDIGVLRAWIDQGAEFRTTIVEAPPKPTDPRVAALVAAVRVQSADAVATCRRFWQYRHDEAAARCRR